MELWREARRLNGEGTRASDGPNGRGKEFNSRDLKFDNLEERQDKLHSRNNFRCDWCTVGENCDRPMCTYAHDDGEMELWREVRRKNMGCPILMLNSTNGPIMCWSVSKGQWCSYGHSCAFAHSEEELKGWLR
jgi:hypothetical protein